jgi:outer membrane protein assembly factor BamB
MRVGAGQPVNAADYPPALDAEVNVPERGTVVVGDWPCWRGPNRDGISQETGWNAHWPDGGPAKLWEAQIGIGYSPVSVVGGRAYTMGNIGRQETVWCFDAATGEVLWKHSYPCRGGSDYPGPRAQPTVDGDRVYTISIKGHLKCFNTDRGGVVWETDVREQLGSKGSAHGHCGSPLVLGEKLILATGAPPATVVAFDKMTGDILWKGGDDPGGYATPTPYLFKGKQCLAVFTGTSMLGMDAATGDVLWRYPWQSKLNIAASTPIVSGDKVFFCTDYGIGGALLQITDGPPKEVWRSTDMSNHFDTCVLWKGHLYGFTPRGSHSVSRKTVLRCMEFATGEVKWSEAGLGIGTLQIADGKLILLGDAGDLVIAEATSEGYKPISRAKVLENRCWTVPVLANGRIYCRDEKGHLVCLDVSD